MTTIHSGKTLRHALFGCACGIATLLAAGGAWAGNEGQIAAFAGGNWLFFAPRDGMRLLDRSSGRDLRYAGGWVAPDRPNAPSGGGVVDSEARAAIAALTQCLVDAGIVPAA